MYMMNLWQIMHTIPLTGDICYVVYLLHRKLSLEHGRPSWRYKAHTSLLPLHVGWSSNRLCIPYWRIQQLLTRDMCYVAYLLQKILSWIRRPGWQCKARISVHDLNIQFASERLHNFNVLMMSSHFSLFYKKMGSWAYQIREDRDHEEEEEEEKQPWTPAELYSSFLLWASCLWALPLLSWAPTSTMTFAPTSSLWSVPQSPRSSTRLP